MKKKEINIDFIGGEGPLTKEEELAISEFLKRKKKQESKLKNRNSSDKPKKPKIKSHK